MSITTKEIDGKKYNYEPSDSVCPTITIHGTLYCVLKNCYYRAIGAACPKEAPKGWLSRADFIVKWNSPEELPAHWIEG